MSKTTLQPMTSAEFDAHCDRIHTARAIHQAEWVRKVLAQNAPEDPCRCGEESTDRATGYVDTCQLHPAALPVPDALARLTASLARSGR